MLVHLLKAFVVMTFGATLGFRIGPSSSPNKSIRAQLYPFVKIYDFEKLDDVLKQLKSQNEFPQLGTAHPDARDTDLLPSKITNRFAKINRVVFGREDVITLFADDGNWAAIHEPGRHVGFPRDLLPMISKSDVMLDFTLAHSVAHYVYEFYIKEISKNQKSLYENSTRSNEVSGSETPNDAAAHAEVDAIAIAILLKLGNSPERIHSELVRNFSASKKVVDDSVGIKINEFTTFAAIPPDFHAKVRDHYVRLLSLLLSFQKRG